MIDMGIVHGQHVWYTSGRTLAELIEAGEVCAVLDGGSVAFKRREACTPIELQAALSLDEVRAIAAELDGQ